MSSRLVVPLVCTAAIVFACGPRNHASTAPVRAGARALRTAAVDGAHRPPQPFHRRARGDTAAVDASFAVVPAAEGVHLELQVVNRSAHRVEIDFPDGRTREFVVVDGMGREVWRWSRGRLFTQTVQNKFLSAGDTTVYQERWRDAAPGTYTAIATLRSNNYPVERRTAFRIGGPSVIVASH